MGLMAKRPRVYFDADERLKLAIELEALKQGLSVTQLIQNTMRAAYPESDKEAAKIIEQRRRPKRD